ncbi:MAG: glycosyltransferase family 2 protein [Phycisphaerae bacterium]|nr:glycosyltransferase family 2 protein [Phycisphaerae bacterium]
MLLAVIIPVYNERACFPRLLERLEGTPPPALPDGARAGRHLYIVDDGSTDGARDVVAALRGRPGVHVLLQDRNRGKGAAIRAGLDAALAAPAPPDVILIQDADLEYDPADHAGLVGPILRGEADVVIGSRLLGGGPRRIGLLHALVNRAITTLSNLRTGLRVTDMECGLKAFTRGVAARLDLREPRFGVEPEIVAKVARMTGVRVREVPVRYEGRSWRQGKKIGWRDGISALRCIWTYSRG